MIVYRKPWTRQPQGAVRLRPDLPADSLAYVASQRHLLKGGDYSPAVYTTTNKGPYSGGIADAGTASSSRIDIGFLPKARVSQGLTVVAQFVVTTTAIRYVEGVVETGFAYIEDLGVNQNQNEANSPGRLMFLLRRSEGSEQTRVASTDAILTIGALHTAVWQFNGLGDVKLWLDGSAKPITAAASLYSDDVEGISGFPFTLLNRNVRNAFNNGGAGLSLGLYARIPYGKVDGAAISANPYRELFAPRQIYGPTGAAAPALPTLTFTGPIPGTVTSTGWRHRVTGT